MSHLSQILCDVSKVATPPLCMQYLTSLLPGRPPSDRDRVHRSNNCEICGMLPATTLRNCCSRARYPDSRACRFTCRPAIPQGVDINDLGLFSTNSTSVKSQTRVPRFELSPKFCREFNCQPPSRPKVEIYPRHPSVRNVLGGSGTEDERSRCSAQRGASCRKS